MKKTLVFAVLNHKGGVAKTTTAVALADFFAQLPSTQKVLLVDADEQSNVKTIFGVKLREADGGLAAVLIQDVRPDAVRTQVRQKLDVILSGGRAMDAFEVKVQQGGAGYLRMKQAFSDLVASGEYDYVIVDCPPALSRVTANVLFFADFVLIPSAPDLLSLVGVKSTIAYMDTLAREGQRHPGHDSMAAVIGVVQTMHDPRRNLDTDIQFDLERLASSNLLNGGVVFSPIRSDIKVKTAQVKRKLLSEHCPGSKAFEDYQRLAQQILERAKAIEADRVASPTLFQQASPAPQLSI